MTGIEWTDATWNPVTGCTKVSPGCAHCYAEAIAPRTFKGRPFTDVRFHAERLVQPSRWKKPRRVFVNSMSDLFHETLTDLQIMQVFSAMRAAPRHTFQVLTKRPDRMLVYMGSCEVDPPPNVWLGVSVENQEMADQRIPLLLDTPAAVRFLSVEPLLGPVHLVPFMNVGDTYDDRLIDWVIVGGESGPKARPCELRWIGSILDQCKVAGVPAFVKQLGARAMHRSFLTDEPGQVRLNDRKGGNPAEWPPELRVREWPAERGAT